MDAISKHPSSVYPDSRCDRGYTSSSFYARSSHSWRGSDVFTTCASKNLRWTSDLQLNYMTKLGALDSKDILKHDSRKVCHPETLNTKPYTLNRSSSCQSVHLPSHLARLEDGLFLNPDATCASTCPGARRGSHMEVRRTIRQQNLGISRQKRTFLELLFVRFPSMGY